MKNSGGCKVPHPKTPTSIKPNAKLGGGPVKYSNEDRGKPAAIDKSSRTVRKIP